MVINQYQTKAVSIVFISLKTNLLSVIAVITAIQISFTDSAKTACDQSMLVYFKLLRVFFSLSAIFDTIMLVYFFFSRDFKKGFYYVFFVFHWIISLICLAGGISKLADRMCSFASTVISGVLAASVIFQFNAIIGMIGKTDFVLKYLHFGSNMVWLIFWYTTPSATFAHVGVSVVGFVHCGLSIVNFLFLVFAGILGKGYNSIIFWRVMTAFSIVMMIVCYLVVIIGVQYQFKSLQFTFFLQVYLRYGLFEMLSPILILISLRKEVADPWALRIKSKTIETQSVKSNEIVDFSQQI